MLVFPILLLVLSMYLVSWLVDATEIAVLWIEDVDTRRSVILSIFAWVILIIIFFTIHPSRGFKLAEKGARTQLEPVARQLYIDGQSLTAIEAALDVSRQTLSAWKGQTKKPSDDLDEWDKARARKANFGLRMEALLERELTFAEERQPGAIDGASLDNLSKLGALVVKFRAQEGNGAGYDKAKVFLENIQWIVAWLQENDPEGLKILATDFDAMTMKFKAECLSGSTNA